MILDNFAEAFVKAQKAFANGNITEASNLAEQMISTNPESIDALFFSAKVAKAQGKIQKSMECIEQVLSRQPEHAEALKFSFDLYLLVEQLFKAYRVVKRLINIEPSDELNYQLAILCTRIGKVEEALDLLEKYTQLHKDNAFAYLNLGHMYKAKKEFDKAAAAYESFITIDPSRIGYAAWNLADLKDNIMSSVQIKRWRQAEENCQKGDPINLALLQFAIATVLERAGDHEQAFTYYEKANGGIEAHEPFKADAFCRFINNILTYTANDVDIVPPTNNPTPIFVLGMPRSGSTLVEQILSSHSDVNATDELNYIGFAAANLERTGNCAQAIAQLNDSQISDLRAEYLSYAGEYQPETAKFFIDKNPLNFLHIGLILKLFPEARIIHTYRNLCDNALSMFKRYFFVGHDYSYSMANIIHFYDGYIRLMKHWDEVFPGRILHFSYESLVENPDLGINKLLSFCQLEVQDSCYKFYEQKNVVLTPSVDQVNKPINNASVNSWQRFKKQIAPYVSTLQGLNCKLDALGARDVEQTELSSSEVWKNYWQQGHITSFGEKFANNYIGAIKSVWQHFFETLTEDAVLLDLATGNGAVLELAHQLLPDDNVTKLLGVDQSSVFNKNSAIEMFSNVSIEDLPFNDNSITHVSSQYGIEYSKIDDSMAEVARVLKPGGYFQFICHSQDSVIIKDNRLIMGCVNRLLKFGGCLTILRSMLLELNKKQLSGTMNENAAEQLRNSLNAEISSLLSTFGDAFYDTGFSELLKVVLRAGVSAEDRAFALDSYIDEQRKALLRLKELNDAALSEEAINDIKLLVANLGMKVDRVNKLEEDGIGTIGVVIKGYKLSD